MEHEHTFWKDRNPPECLNCGKTWEEINKNFISDTELRGEKRMKDSIRDEIEKLAQDPPLESNERRRGFHQMANSLLSFLNK